MDIKKEIDTSDYPVGVAVARFQVHKLHDAHRMLIDKIFENHKKVIIFLGVPMIENTQSNPMDFATRKAMVQETYPTAVILPLYDKRTNEDWSKQIDDIVPTIYGNIPALLYGGRDSFIPYYKGHYKTVELTTSVYYSGTEVRKQVSREILSSEDFRAGIIHANYAKRPVTYPTVDVIIKNENGEILLAKKVNEDKYRLVGGFVSREDDSLENTVKSVVSRECGNIEVGDIKYIGSSKVNDWRYKGSESGIMTTVFECKFMFGSIQPSDDLVELRWFKVEDIKSKIIDSTLMMEEHISLMTMYINKK